jgi:hypothetical protein
MGARARQSLVIVLCAGVTCCGGSSPGMQPAAATPLVVITSFTVDPSTLFVGQQARLRYSATRPAGSTVRVEYSASLGSVALDPADATAATYLPTRAGTDVVVLTLTMTAPQQAQATGQVTATVIAR